MFLNIRLNSEPPITARVRSAEISLRIWDTYENHTCMLLFHFYVWLYVFLRYLILEYLPALIENF